MEHKSWASLALDAVSALAQQAAAFIEMQSVAGRGKKNKQARACWSFQVPPVPSDGSVTASSSRCLKLQGDCKQSGHPHEGKGLHRATLRPSLSSQTIRSTLQSQHSNLTDTQADPETPLHLLMRIYSTHLSPPLSWNTTQNWKNHPNITQVLQQFRCPSGH